MSMEFWFHMISFILLTTKHYFNGNINPFFMICTVLVMLESHGTGIHILHGRVNLMMMVSEHADVFN